MLFQVPRGEIMYYKKILPYVISALATVPAPANTNVDGTHTDKNENKVENVIDSAINTAMGALANKAMDAPGNAVVYIYSDGSRVIRNNGTRAWRNNNPGNLRYYDFAKDHGAIGEAGKFAVFPDEKTGMQALYKLLQTESYRNLTIENALKRYAPVTWEKYTRKLTGITGLSANARLCNLNQKQLNTVVKTIRDLEGWIPGTEKRINAPLYAEIQAIQQNAR